MAKLFSGLGKSVKWVLKAAAFLVAWGAFAWGMFSMAFWLAATVDAHFGATLPLWQAFGISVLVFAAVVVLAFFGLRPVAAFMGF